MTLLTYLDPALFGTMLSPLLIHMTLDSSFQSPCRRAAISSVSNSVVHSVLNSVAYSVWDSVRTLAAIPVSDSVYHSVYNAVDFNIDNLIKLYDT